jgi:fluoroacetyl-CoA thioesterase
VGEQDLAEFETGLVHPFYATFALGRDAEWASRQFVLEMLEDDEEGIGTFLTIEHQSPALLGETVVITAEITLLEKNSIHCKYAAHAGNRVVATGTTGQKILKREKVEKIIAGIQGGNS